MSRPDAAFLLTWLGGAVHLAGPVLLAALGEIFAERAGVLNVGLEGVILLGALSSFLVAGATGLPWLGVGAAIGTGLLAGLLLAGSTSMRVRARWSRSTGCSPGRRRRSSCCRPSSSAFRRCST